MSEVLAAHPFKEQPQNDAIRLVQTIEAPHAQEARLQFAQNLSERIKKADGPIIINSHKSPDPDAVCSALALARHQRKLHPDKTFQVVFSDQPFKVFNPLQKQEDEITWAGGTQKTDASGHTRPGDVADHPGLKVCLDGAHEERFSNVPEELKPVVILDHHPEEPNNAELRYTEPKASSTCELIARMYPVDSFDPDVAGLLWLGIMRDTQNLRIPGDYGDLKELSAKLLTKSGKGAEELQNLIPKTDQQKMYEEAFKRHITPAAKEGLPKAKYSYLKQEEIQPVAKIEDTPYIRSEARRDFMFDLSQTGDSELYWTFLPTKPGEYSISFRRGNDSKIDLNALAKKLSADKNKGGGHVAAASSTVRLSQDEIRHIQEEKAKNPAFDEMSYVGEKIVEKIHDAFTTKPEEVKPREEKHNRQDRPERNHRERRSA